MAVLTSTLIANLRDRVSGPARRISGSLGRLRDTAAMNARSMDQMRGRILDAAGMGYVLARAISAPVKAAMEFEEAMADINKVVDFPQPDGLKRMSADILAMSRAIPVSAKGIADIVAAAGQAGMQNDELLAFTEIAAKVGVAFGMTADQTGESLAKIKTALGLTVTQTSELADVLNHLSNTSASAAPDLLGFMRRVGSAGLQYGFAARETAAIGSAMIASGAQADVAATSFRNVGKALARGESATKRQNKAFSALGLSATNVAKQLQQDAVGTLHDVIARIRALPREMRASTISDLFGDEARAVMPLIENAGLLKEALGQVADETNYLGSAQKEFEVRSETFAANLQLFKNRLDELAISLGNALLPALSSIMAVIQPLISTLAELASANPQVTASVAGLAAGVVALRVAAIGARFALMFLKGGVLDAAIGLSRSVGVLSSGAAGLANFARMARRVGLSMTVLSMTGGTGIFAALVSGATAAAAAVAGLTAPIWGTVAAAVGLGLAIHKYWEPIAEFVTGFASAITGALAPAMNALTSFAADVTAAAASWAGEKLIDVASWLGFDEASVRGSLATAQAVLSSSLDSIVELVMSVPSRVGGWVSDLFTMNDYSDEAEAEFRSAGARVGQALVNGIKSAFETLWQWLKAIPGRIVDAIG
ncbi:MAG: phage tail tape measure protein, partial [Nisaea sp.]|uniref:phage tail tape measure protein n=1 Tax=Nisaea sp. TaxID=2024842 RepID=UPI003263BDD0